MRTKSEIRAIAAVAALLTLGMSGSGALAQSAKVIVDGEGTCANCVSTLGEAVTRVNLGTETTIVLDGPRGPGGEVLAGAIKVYDDTNALLSTAGRNVTIRGDGSFQPWQIVVRGKQNTAPAIDIAAGSDVTLSNLTISGGSAGVVVTAATVVIERCLIKENTGVGGLPGVGGEGLRIVGSSEAVVACSSFFANSGPGIAVTAGTLYAIQNTFLQNNRGAIAAQAGNVYSVANLALDNGGSASFSNTLGEFKSVGDVSEGPGAFAANVQRLGIHSPSVTNTVLAPSPVWPGDVAVVVPTQLNRNDVNSILPGVASQFKHANFDFEGDARGQQEVQAGADEEGATAALAWLGLEVLPPELPRTQDGIPAAKKGTALVFNVLLGDGLNVDLTGDPQGIPLHLLLVPEVGRQRPEGVPRRGAAVTGLDGTGATANDYYFTLTPTGVDADANAKLVTYSLLVEDTVMQGKLADGRAQVFLGLVDEQTGATYSRIYGEDVYDDNADEGVALGVFDNDELLIDTVPPALFNPENTPLTAYAFYGESSSDTAASEIAVAGWRPSTENVPWNAATLFGSGGTPQLYFNSPDGLWFTLRAAYADQVPVLPEDVDAIEISGMQTFNLNLDPDGGEAGAVLFGDARSAENPVPVPVWAVAADGRGSAVLESDHVVASFQDAVDDQNRPFVDARWTVLGQDTGDGTYIIPFERNNGNDWRLGLRFRAADVAGNEVAQENDEVVMWWMWGTAAKITSGPSSGQRSPDPSLTYALDRSSGPQGASPCDPVFSYRLYASKNSSPDTLFNGDWEFVNVPGWEEWSPWDTAQAVVVPAEVLTASVNRYLLFVVRGADEAGNVSVLPPGTDGDVLSGAEAATLVSDYGPVARHWYNPGPGVGVETQVSARFWYNLVEDTAGGPVNDPSFHRVVNADFGERDLGSVTRIPLPPVEADRCQRIEAQFTVGVKSSDASLVGGPWAEWFLYEDGRRVAGGVLLMDGASGVLTFPEDLFTPNANPGVNLLFYPTNQNGAPDRNGPPIESPPFEQVSWLNNGDPETPCAGLEFQFLGDTGENRRKRAVEYIFTVQGGVGYGTAAQELDSTPASVKFTVFPETTPETEVFKEEQPFKTFTRD